MIPYHNITDWKFITVKLHGPFLGLSTFWDFINNIMNVFFSATDLPYDNETRDDGQKDCSHYLFVCNSESDVDECPFEVRCYCVCTVYYQLMLNTCIYRSTNAAIISLYYYFHIGR